MNTLYILAHPIPENPEIAILDVLQTIGETRYDQNMGLWVLLCDRTENWVARHLAKELQDQYCYAVVFLAPVLRVVGESAVVEERDSITPEERNRPDIVLPMIEDILIDTARLRRNSLG